MKDDFATCVWADAKRQTTRKVSPICPISMRRASGDPTKQLELEIAKEDPILLDDIILEVFTCSFGLSAGFVVVNYGINMGQNSTPGRNSVLVGPAKV